MLYLYLALSFGSVLLFARKPIQCPLFFLGTFLALLLLHALVLIVASLFVSKKQPNPKGFPFYRKLLTASIGPLLQLGGVRVDLRGAEKLPAGGFLLGKKRKVSRFLWGLLIGAIYFGVYMLLAVCTQDVPLTDILWVAIPVCLGGMAGGMLS